MPSLTSHIKNNDRLNDYLLTIGPHLKKTQFLDSKIENMYPDFIDQHHLWGLMGTYTDYMIRKMVMQKFDNVVSDKLICEISYELMKPKDVSWSAVDVRTLDEDFPWDMIDDLAEFPHDDITRDPPPRYSNTPTFYTIVYNEHEYRKRGHTIYRRPYSQRSAPNRRTQDVYNSFNNIHKSNIQDCILKYKDKNSTWIEVIEDTFYLAQLDSYYREGKLESKFEFPRDQLASFQGYFQKIWDYIPSLELKEPILLNPNLATLFCPADADIIDEQSIIEIKTSKFPPKVNDLYQLLGYLALYYNKTKIIAQNLIIFNPLYLGFEKYSCKGISPDTLIRIIQYLS